MKKIIAIALIGITVALSGSVAFAAPTNCVGGVVVFPAAHHGPRPSPTC